MSIFTNKSILKKIVLVLVFILLLNFISPNIVQAKSYLAIGGGTLFLPLQDLIVFLADLFLGTLQRFMLGSDEVVVQAKGDTNVWDIVKNIVVLGSVVVIGGIALLYTGGTAVAAIAAVGSAGVTMTTISSVAAAMLTVVTTGGVILWRGVETADAIKGSFDLPVFIYTPEKIFANEVPALDINFIQPSKDVEIQTYKNAVDNTNEVKNYMEELVSILGKHSSSSSEAKFYKEKLEDYVVRIKTDTQAFIDEFKNSSKLEQELQQAVDVAKKCIEEKIGTNDSNIYKELTSNVPSDYTLNTPENIKEIENYLNIVIRGITQSLSWMSESEAQQMIQYQDQIREYKYDLQDDPSLFFAKAEEVKSTVDSAVKLATSKLQFDYTVIKDGDYKFLNEPIPSLTTKEGSVSDGVLQSSAKVLRGIISSWYNTLRYIAIVGLLCVLVYIGIRIIISSTAAEKAKYKNMIKDWLVAMCLLFVLHFIMSFTLVISESITDMVRGMNEGIMLKLPEGGKFEGEAINEWPTNLMGYARFMLQADDPFTAFSFTVIYLALVILTFSFTITYLKRVINMAFLTMIAPLVALTYPIDKIKDGKAQAFNMLIKEYIFNALIQPIHFLLYTIFVGSAMSLAIDNPLYAIVVLGFMTTAEGFIRRMFGFESAKTVGGFGAAATGAFIANQVSRMGKRKPKPEEEKTPIRTKSDADPDIKGFQDILGGGSVITDGTDLASTGSVGYGANGMMMGANGTMMQNGYVANSMPMQVSGIPVQNKNGQNVTQSGIILPGRASSIATSGQGGGAVPTSGGAVATSGVIAPPGSKADTKGKQKRNFGQRLLGGVESLGGYGARRIKRAMDPKKLGKTFRKVAFRGVGLAGGAAIGAALSITDPSKTMQYMTGSMYAGMNGLDIVGNKAAGLTSGTVEAFKSGYYGEEYGQKINKKLNKQFMNDEQNVQYLRSKGIDPEEFMKNTAKYYLDAKITDIKKIAKLEKMARKKADEYGGIDEARRHYRALGQLEKTINANVWGDTAKRNELIQDRFNAYVQRGVAQDLAMRQARQDAEDLEDVATA